MWKRASRQLNAGTTCFLWHNSHSRSFPSKPCFLRTSCIASAILKRIISVLEENTKPEKSHPAYLRLFGCCYIYSNRFDVRVATVQQCYRATFWVWLWKATARSLVVPTCYVHGRSAACGSEICPLARLECLLILDVEFECNDHLLKVAWNHF